MFWEQHLLARSIGNGKILHEPKMAPFQVVLPRNKDTGDPSPMVQPMGWTCPTVTLVKVMGGAKVAV